MTQVAPATFYGFCGQKLASKPHLSHWGGRAGCVKGMGLWRMQTSSQCGQLRGQGTAPYDPPLGTLYLIDVPEKKGHGF